MNQPEPHNETETISRPSLLMLFLFLAASGLVTIIGIVFLFRLLNNFLT